MRHNSVFAMIKAILIGAFIGDYLWTKHENKELLNTNKKCIEVLKESNEVLEIAKNNTKEMLDLSDKLILDQKELVKQKESE